MSRPPAVDVRGVTYGYPGSSRAAIADVTLAVASGEVLAIAGESGSGKSTLARLVAGLLRPDAGSVSLGGVELRGLRPRDVAGRVGIVFQHPNHQLLTSTVREELALGPGNLGLASAVVATRVEAAARSFGLEDALDEHPFRLPLSARRRLGLASVIAMEPPVLVLDEPTAGLDARETSALIEILAVLTGGGRSTSREPAAVVVVTHDLRFAGRVADRIVALRSGAVVEDAPASSLLADADRLDAAGLEAPPLVRLAAAMGIDPRLAASGVDDRLVAAVEAREAMG